MSIESCFNADLSIQRRQNVGTDFRPVWEWTELDNVRGLIDMLSERWLVRNEGGAVVADHIAYIMPFPVRVKDRIVSGENTYDVYSVHDPNGKGHHYELKMLLMPEGSGDAES